MFTGGGGAGTEALRRYFDNKYDVYFADASINHIDCSIPYDHAVSIPLAQDDVYISTLVNVSSQLQIDFLVPGVDEELIKIANAKELFAANVFVPSSDFVELMLNKYDCAYSILDAGLTAPKTRQVSKANEIGFPLIVKPKSGRGSRGVMTVKSQKELDAYRNLFNTEDEDLIVQELGEGQEYTVLVSANKAGELNGIIPVKVNQKKGITISAKIEMNELVIDYAKKFHNKFRTPCVYNIQCILTDENVILPFEVNPRISTTFCMSIAAGFDPFKLYFRKNTEEDLFIPSNKICLRRNWKNNIFECGR